MNVLADSKHGLRVLLRTPLFTICTIAALAIGIGATTVLFSVVHAMLLKPLPYPDADRLLVIWEHNLPRNRMRNVVNPLNFMGWRDRSRSFDGMGALVQNRVTLTGSGEPAEIIGVVGDVRLVSLDGEIRPTAYLSSGQYAFGIMTYVVRTAGDPATLGPAAARVIAQIDPLLPVSAVRPLDEVFAESIARPRLTALAMSVFAAAALLLALLGVYGIVAYSVSQRSREFGLRVALGARPGQIIGLVVAQNLRVVGLGLGAGLLAAVPTTRMLQGLLFEVGPNDPATFAAIGVLLAIVATVAAYLPARRGTQVDPVVTLKAE